MCRTEPINTRDWLSALTMQTTCQNQKRRPEDRLLISVERSRSGCCRFFRLFGFFRFHALAIGFAFRVYIAINQFDDGHRSVIAIAEAGL